MKKLCILVSFLLLASTFVIIQGSVGSGGAKNSGFIAYAEEPKDELVNAAGGAAGPAGQVVAASGNNRFVVWFDNTPGNYDIFFRRSTDSGATWQPTVNLSNNPGSSHSAQIEVSGSNVYVVWNQVKADATSANVFFRRSTDNGATWGPQVKVSASGTTFDGQPQIESAGSYVHIAWKDGGGTHDVFTRRSADNGATWKPIVNLSNNAGDSALPQIAAAGSNVYVVWQDLTPGNYDTLFRRSADNGATWKATVNISNNAGTSALPQVAAAGTNVYVVWHDNTPGNYDIFSRRSVDAGATMQPLVQLSNNAGSSVYPDIALAGSNIYVAWFDSTPGNNDILFRRSADNGATWKTTKNISTNAGNSVFPQVGAAGSNVYVVWFDPTPGNYDIFLRRSTDNGATMQPLVQISNNAGNSIYPQVATVGPNVYIAWQDDTPGNQDILSRRSADNGSTWKVVKNLSSNAGVSSLGEIAG